MLHEIRKFCASFLLGAAVAAYGMHNYVYSLNSDLEGRMVEGGWCADRDPRRIVYLFACRDSYYAAQLQHDDSISAAAQAEADSILAQMSVTKKKAKKR